MPEKITPEQQKELEEKLKSMSPEEIMQLQKQQCIFCQIIAGKIPSKKIYEDEKVFVVLDINPAAKGHVLLLPKEHYAIMPQVPDKDLGHYFLVARSFSHVLLKTLQASGTSIFIANGLAAGQKAQHFILHIIPRKEGDGLLKAEEKIIRKDVQEKVRIAVENKLNEVLGTGREVVTMTEKQEEEKSPVHKKTARKATKEDTKKPARKDSTKSREKPAETEEQGGSISLDEIADLFK